MNTIKHLIMSFALLATAQAFAQNDIERVQSVADAIAENCGSPQWGPDSLKSIQNYSLYRLPCFYD